MFMIIGDVFIILPSAVLALIFQIVANRCRMWLVIEGRWVRYPRVAPDAAIPIGGPLLEHVLGAAALVVLVDLAPLPPPTPTVLAPVPCALAVVIAVCSRLLGSAPLAPSCIVIAAVLSVVLFSFYWFRGWFSPRR